MRKPVANSTWVRVIGSTIEGKDCMSSSAISISDLNLSRLEFRQLESEGFVTLGERDEIQIAADIEVLRPRRKRNSADNTYFARFGYGPYPLHTDHAVEFRSPRYLLLQAIVGCELTFTRVGRFLDLPQEVVSSMKRCLVRPRRKGGRSNVTLSLASHIGETTQFRWDSVFLEPLSGNSATLFGEIGLAIAEYPTENVVLRKAGDALLIDNWRAFHGRTAVAPAARKRRLARFYLES